ncbi:MAG: DHA2 family efflux MFS transporter permease subunit [Candidatus Peribacteraceae bacterium]|nr:DHA2 family efflux MFS transporter permease subunit [Candidatus Peribacteraceae bacterium]MDD5742360.1 DHA2 family efflux MFS transporter permease subunit [Candidatus Peribacteraceae bacterium]
MSSNDSTAGSAVPRWIILLTVIIGTFLGRLDQTIVNLALPKIIDDYHITVTAAGWIATAYILANAVFVPVWGKLGDTIGRKRVYIMGFILFIVGSMLAGFAWNLSSMIVFRVIQAIAGSADYPTAMAILAVTYQDEKERAQALGIWSSSFAAAAVFGPLIGGPLIDHFSWRAVFLINIPVGIIGVLMAIAFITESVSERKTQAFDLKGAVVLGIALSALVLVLDKGLDWGWLSLRSFLCYGISLFSTLYFIRVESRHREPIVDIKFFRNNLFVQALLNNFVVFMGMMGSIFLIPIFAQTFLGYDATHTGLLFIPMAAAIMIAAPFGGRLTGIVQPKYVILISTLVAACGLFLFLSLDPRSGPIDIILPLIVMASGIGFGMAQRTNIIANAVPVHEVGIASSVLALARNIAGAFGIAVFGTILQTTAENNVITLSRFSTFHSTDPNAYAQFIALISLKAQIGAYHTVFIASGLVVLFGALLALFIPNVRMKPGVKVHVE